MKQYNGEKYIVSFTSFPARFNMVAKMLYYFLKQNIDNRFHICCTLYKDDYEKLSGDFKLFVDNDIIEVIIADKNLCPHLKYFYAMKKYWDKPIITVDDDRLYDINILNALVNKYESLNYKSIVSTCAPCMSITRNKIDLHTKWCVPWRRLKPNAKSYIAMAEGFGGVLYPPKCFANLDDEIKDINKCLYHDDLFLKVLAIKNVVPVTQINGTLENFYLREMSEANSTNLATRHNAPMKYRCDVVNVFNDILAKGFELK